MLHWKKDTAFKCYLTSQQKHLHQPQLIVKLLGLYHEQCYEAIFKKCWPILFAQVVKWPSVGCSIFINQHGGGDSKTHSYAGQGRRSLVVSKWECKQHVCQTSRIHPIHFDDVVQIAFDTSPIQPLPLIF